MCQLCVHRQHWSTILFAELLLDPCIRSCSCQISSESINLSESTKLQRSSPCSKLRPSKAIRCRTERRPSEREKGLLVDDDIGIEGDGSINMMNLHALCTPQVISKKHTTVAAAASSSCSFQRATVYNDGIQMHCPRNVTSHSLGAR